MFKLTNDVSYLFILAQMLFFGSLIAFVVFLAVSDRRASKRLDEEERAEKESQNTSKNPSQNSTQDSIGNSSGDSD